MLRYNFQIAKLSMIPVSCLLEVLFDKIRYSRDTKLSIAVVLLGVGVCTITDVSVNAKGFVAAFIAVWSTSLQQYVSCPLYILLSCMLVSMRIHLFICTYVTVPDFYLTNLVFWILFQFRIALFITILNCLFAVCTLPSKEVFT